MTSDTSTVEQAPALDAATLPPPRPLGRRLAYSAFRAVNRVWPKQDRILLHCTSGFEDGVQALLDELTARGFAAAVLVEEPERPPVLAAPRLTLVPKRSLNGVVHFLGSRWVVTTHSVFANEPPPPGQVQVNIWHGEPPTKETSRFVPGQSGVACSVAPVCSHLGRAYRAAEFNLSPFQVPIVGAPRNDRMLRADRLALRRALLGEDVDSTTLLWLPSFRSGQWRGGRQRLDVAAQPYPGLPYPSEDIHRLDDWLVQHAMRIVVKPHPHDADSLSGDYKAIRVLAPADLEDLGLTLYPVLSAFDGLITDVSSVWVDYLLMDKPLIFAFPDIEEYRRGRGLNLEPYEDWVPGPFTRTIDELEVALADIAAGRDAMAEERQRALVRFHRFHDDRSAARLLDNLGLRASASPPLSS